MLWYTNLRALSKCPMPLPNPGMRRRGEECSVLEFESLQGLGLVTSEFWREMAYFYPRSVGSSRDLHRSEAKFLVFTLKPHKIYPRKSWCKFLHSFSFSAHSWCRKHRTRHNRTPPHCSYCSFFGPLVPYCFTLTVSTPSRSLFYLFIFFS